MALLGELDYVLIASPSTSFAGIIPHVVVEEVPRDALVITQHPVERGAAIADHAYKLPVILEMRAGWSNSTVGEEGFCDALYEELLQVQAIREPFDVFTPRRLYPSMLIRSIVAPRDERTNSVLFVNVTFEEIIITSTSQGGAGGLAGGVGSPGNQAMPSTTQGTADRGAVQLGSSSITLPLNIAGAPVGLSGLAGQGALGTQVALLPGAFGR